MPTRRRMIQYLAAGAAGLLAGCAALPRRRAAAPRRLYIGTFSVRGSEGIYHAAFDDEEGALHLTGHTGGVQSPAFLAAPPGADYVYAVEETETYEGASGGSVAAFARSAAGDLRFINRQASRGGSPCHIAVSARRRCAVVSNYSGGSVAVLPLRADGGLDPASAFVQHTGSGPHAERQQGPHVHSATFGPGERIVYVADLGADRVIPYTLEPGGRLRGAPEPFRAAPGSGPRHTALHPSGRWLYVAGELSSTVSALRIDPQSGALEHVATRSTLPEGWQGENTNADIHATPDGRFVLVSNRGRDSLAVFAVDAATGALAPAGHQPTGGRTPRNFAIAPSGRWVLAANQNSDEIVVFSLNPETGGLAETGARVQVPSPVCILFA